MEEITKEITEHDMRQGFVTFYGYGDSIDGEWIIRNNTWVTQVDGEYMGDRNGKGMYDYRIYIHPDTPFGTYICLRESSTETVNDKNDLKEKTNDPRVTAKEAAKIIKKFGRAMQVGSIIDQKYAEEWLTYSSGKTFDDLDQIINAMLDGGMLVPEINNWLKLSVKKYKKEYYEALGYEEIERAKEVMNQSWFKEYMKMQPHSREEVLHILIERFKGGLTVEQVVKPMRDEYVNNKAREMSDSLMKFDTVEEYLTYGIESRDDLFARIFNANKLVLLGKKPGMYASEIIFELNQYVATHLKDPNTLEDRSATNSNFCGAKYIRTGEQGSETSAIKPGYYGKKGSQPIDYIRANNLGFNIGNVIKYVTRAGKKNPEKHIEDLEKAAFYLNEEINILKYPHLHEQRMREHAALEEEYRRKLEDE